MLGNCGYYTFLSLLSLSYSLEYHRHTISIDNNPIKDKIKGLVPNKQNNSSTGLWTKKIYIFAECRLNSGIYECLWLKEKKKNYTKIRKCVSERNQIIYDEEKSMKIDVKIIATETGREWKINKWNKDNFSFWKFEEKNK